jgi:tetratricopeptide (TPR) repeat protein
LASQGAIEAAVQGAAAACEELKQLPRKRRWTEHDDEVLPEVLSSVDGLLADVSLERGDMQRALDHAHRCLTREVGRASVRDVPEALDRVTNLYRRLGLFSDARLFAQHAIELLKYNPGVVAGWTLWLGFRDDNEARIESAISRYESALSLYLAAAEAEHGPHRRAGWLREAAYVLYYGLAFRADAATAARHFEAAEALLGQAARAADEAASPEERALTRRRFAALAEARKQWAQAESEHLAFLAWAEVNWGPYKRAEVLLDLARVARERPDLTLAADYAQRAQREVDIDPPEYRNRFVAIAAARELARIRKAQGDATSAHTALDAALSIARGDGLRLREREILLDLAELPPPRDGPDLRLEHATRARTIAQDAAFPVDEAEAMLVLAELHLDAGHARRARAMFEQAAWIVDRIGPPAVRERASRLRDRLGAPTPAS